MNNTETPVSPTNVTILPIHQDLTLLPILIRTAIPEDISFIFDSWLKTYRDVQPGRYAIRSGLYFREQRALIESLLLLPTTTVTVAVNPESANQIYGYLCYQAVPDGSSLIVHWLQVKGVFRRLKVATRLLSAAVAHPDCPVTFTHYSPEAQKLAPTAIFNPYLAAAGVN